jgi:hypothetical protein
MPFFDFGAFAFAAAGWGPSNHGAARLHLALHRQLLTWGLSAWHTARIGDVAPEPAGRGLGNVGGTEGALRHAHATVARLSATSAQMSTARQTCYRYPFFLRIFFLRIFGEPFRAFGTQCASHGRGSPANSG